MEKSGQMRDVLKNDEYFSRLISTLSTLVERRRARASDSTRPYEKRIGDAYGLWRSSTEVAIANYSMGSSINGVRESIEDAIDNLSIFNDLIRQDVSYAMTGEGGGYSGGFDQWYQLLAFCIVFDLDRSHTDIAVEYVRLQMSIPEHSKDALVDQMMRTMGYEGHDAEGHLLWPEAYAPLFACYMEHDAYREDNLKQFVRDWYSSMTDTGWHDAHKGRHDAYFGYWCFEAAAVAKGLRINDKQLKSHPHYPYDARHSDQ